MRSRDLCSWEVRHQPELSPLSIAVLCFEADHVTWILASDWSIQCFEAGEATHVSSRAGGDHCTVDIQADTSRMFSSISIDTYIGLF